MKQVTLIVLISLSCLVLHGRQRVVHQDLFTEDRIEVRDPLITTDSLPHISVYFSADDGVTWFHESRSCAITYGSHTTARAYVISEGKITITRNFCVGSRTTHYQVVIN